MPTLTLPEFAPGLPAARVDASLRQALAACDQARECAALWFAEVARRGLYRQLGHASLQLYATQDLGFSDNRYHQFKRLADDLERLPVLREAVATGQVGWTKAQQVARVATEATQAAWVEKAVTTGRRELERQVRHVRQVQRATKRRAVAPAQLAFAAAGEPTDVETVTPLLAEAPTTISLRADSVRLARYEALVAKAHKLGLAPAGGDRLDLVLAALESLVAAGGGEMRPAAGPTAQIIVQQCPDCERAAVTTSRGEKRVAPAQLAALACDARVRRPGQANRATIPPSVRAAVLARDRHRCATPGCGSTHFLEVHHVRPRGQGGTNRAENLITLCSRCHGFVHERGGAVAPAQAEAG
ncbi:MAG: HNH endonuclease [bacterium]|nr:HNH endonuclease [bacterium]